MHDVRGALLRPPDGVCLVRRVEFRPVAVPAEGTLRTFTIVHMAAQGIPVPFVAGVVDCGGTLVKGNVVNTPPDPT